MTKKSMPPRAFLARVKFGSEIRDAITVSQMSYKAIVSKNTEMRGYPFSPAMISRIVGGTHTPPWQLLAQLLRVIGVPEATIEQHWQPRFAQLTALIKTIEAEAREGQTLSELLAELAATCPICSAIVVDLDTHTRWHQEMSGAHFPARTPRVISRAGGGRRLRSVPTGANAVSSAV